LAVAAKIPAQRGCAAIEGLDDIGPDAGRVAYAAGEDDGAAGAVNEEVKLYWAASCA
jgi:hypothetical protein